MINWLRGRSPLIISNRERVMDEITAYQLTSMMEGVVDRGTAAATVNLDVAAAGKTGTTNDARDVWFVGFHPTSLRAVTSDMTHHAPLGSRGRGRINVRTCVQRIHAIGHSEIRRW